MWGLLGGGVCLVWRECKWLCYLHAAVSLPLTQATWFIHSVDMAADWMVNTCECWGDWSLNCLTLNDPYRHMPRAERRSVFAGAEVHPVSALHASAGPGKDLPGSKSARWAMRDCIINILNSIARLLEAQAAPSIFVNEKFSYKDPSPPSVSLSPLAVDLLKRMLVLDCDGRISASEALSHPYFSQYHDPDDEPEAPPYDQTLESKDRTLEEWKGKLSFGKKRAQQMCLQCIHGILKMSRCSLLLSFF